MKFSFRCPQITVCKGKGVESPGENKGQAELRKPEMAQKAGSEATKELTLQKGGGTLSTATRKVNAKEQYHCSVPQEKILSY